MEKTFLLSLSLASLSWLQSKKKKVSISTSSKIYSPKRLINMFAMQFWEFTYASWSRRNLNFRQCHIWVIERNNIFIKMQCSTFRHAFPTDRANSNSKKWLFNEKEKYFSRHVGFYMNFITEKHKQITKIEAIRTQSIGTLMQVLPTWSFLSQILVKTWFQTFSKARQKTFFY